MKKRIWLTMLSVLMLVTLVASPVLSYDPLYVSVDVSDMDVIGGHFIGDEITASGTVTVTATAEAHGFPSFAYAESDAWYSISDPGASVVSGGAAALQDFDMGLFSADADASQTFEWSETFQLGRVGEYNIEQGGSGYAMYSQGFWFWHSSGSESAEAWNSVLWQSNKVTAALPDRFTVNILGTSKEYRWEGGYTDGRVLRDAVDLQGAMNGCQLRLYIPAGTVVNEDATRGYELEVNCYQDRITVKTVPSSLTFSEPVTLYRADNGFWKEVSTFTELANGQEL